jgi:hypothetical protein
MTKPIRRPSKKTAKPRSLKRVVGRLEDAYHQTIEARNASKLFSKRWEYHDGHADGIAFALQEVKSANVEVSHERGG